MALNGRAPSAVAARAAGVRLNALALLRRAAGTRHGLVSPAMHVPLGAADPIGIFHASVPDEGDSARGQAGPVDTMRSAGGGVGRSAGHAETAALGEALERYAASTVRLSVEQLSSVRARGVPTLGLDAFTLHSVAQQANSSFPNQTAYPSDPVVTALHSLLDNSTTWIPAVLVALSRDFGGLATSSGLAADFSPTRALLRATQELVERDAYVTTWVHGLAPASISTPSVAGEAAACGGWARVYDLTPAYSPHPVACVAGSLPLRGRNRNSLGLACRANWDDAVEKAFLEFTQGTMFIGHHLARNPELGALTPETCTGFDEHAVYWTVHGAGWNDLPLHRGWLGEAPTCSRATTDAAQLDELVHELEGNGVRLWYRRLPAAGLDQLGLHVVRVVSPELVPLHHDHNWPFLGGKAGDLSWRYPHLTAHTSYPSPYPHALG